MSGRPHDFLRKLALSVGSVLARSLPRVGMPAAMTYRYTDKAPRDGVERRADAVTADVVQVGIVFMDVFGRDNAEAYFWTAAIEPDVYRRILAGRFRSMARGGDPDPESVPA